MENAEYYVNLIRFFRDWNYVKIAAFYRDERALFLSPEYIIKEDNYFQKYEDRKLLTEIAKKEYIHELAKILGNKEIAKAYEKLKTEEFIDWIEKEIEPEYRTILLALSKRYLLEWLYFSQDNLEQIVVTFLQRKPEGYDLWADEYEEGEKTRRELDLNDRNNYMRNYFYKRIVGKENLKIMFYGLNGGELCKHSNRIIKLLVKHRIFDEVKSEYTLQWKRHKEKWDQDLFIEETDVPNINIRYPEISESQKKFFESVLTDWIEDDNKKQKCELKVNVEKVYHIIYDVFKDGQNKKEAKAVLIYLMKNLYKKLEEKKLIDPNKRRKQYTPFVRNVVNYIYSSLDFELHDRLRDTKLPKLTEEQDRIVKRKGKEFETSISKYINSLPKIKTGTCIPSKPVGQN